MLQDKLDNIGKRHKGLRKVADGKSITDHWHDFWNSDNKWDRVKDYAYKGFDWMQNNPGKTALAGTALLAAVTDPLGIRKKFTDNNNNNNNNNADNNNNGSNLANWLIPLLGGGLLYAGLRAAAGFNQTKANIDDVVSQAGDLVESTEQKVENIEDKVETAVGNIPTNSPYGGTQSTVGVLLTGGPGPESDAKANAPITDNTVVARIWDDTKQRLVNVTRGEYRNGSPELKQKVLEARKANVGKDTRTPLIQWTDNVIDTVLDWTPNWLKN